MSADLRPEDLRRLGIRAVFGDVVTGAGRVSTPVADPQVARLLAHGDARTHGELAATWLDGELTTFSPTGPIGPDGRQQPHTDLADAVAVIDAATLPVVLCGPGVVHDSAVDGLRALAATLSAGVLNTWGAKGVFPWDDPHHLGTIGLQALDFQLGGLAHTDLIIATGLDPHEAPAERWELSPSVTVSPADLAALADRLRPRPDRRIAKPVLWGLLAHVTQDGWDDPVPPIQPSRATRTYAEVLTEHGLAVADPGEAGFWVARTFPTPAPRTAIVPTAAEPTGLAAACALASRIRHPGRPVLLALDVEPDPPTQAVLTAADRLGLGIGVEAWGPGGRTLDARHHAERVRRLVEGGRHSRVELLTPDPAQHAAMVAVAGPIVAWS